MIINHRFQFVDGNFETDTGELICVGNRKYGTVHLSFKGKMNIGFAKIVLHGMDRAVEADAVFDDAMKLGNEIAERWNKGAKQVGQ
jgi:hypothetical protein